MRAALGLGIRPMKGWGIENAVGQTDIFEKSFTNKLE